MENVLRLLLENTHLARRFGAGTFVLVLLSLGLATEFQVSTLTNEMFKETLKSLFGNPLIILSLIMIAYFVGIVVEIFGGLVIPRVAGSLVWSYSYPLRVLNWAPRILRYFCRAGLWLFVSPFLLYYYLPRSMFGVSDYRIELMRELSPSAASAFAKLRASTRAGFENPFGINALHARQDLKAAFSEYNRLWFERIQENNRDILTISTCLLVPGVLFVLSYLKSSDGGQLVSLDQADFYILFYYSMILALAMSYLYIFNLRRWIVSALELYGSEHSIDAEATVRDEKWKPGAKPRPRPVAMVGQILQNSILYGLVLVFILNIIKWNFYGVNFGWSDFGLDWLVFIPPDSAIYEIVTANDLRVVYRPVFGGVYWSIFLTIMLLVTRRRFALTIRDVGVVVLAMFIGYTAGRLLTEILFLPVFVGEQPPSWVYGLKSVVRWTLAPAGVIGAVGFILQRYMNFSLRARTRKIVQILAIYAVTIGIGVVLSRTIPRIDGFNIGGLCYSVSIYLALALALIAIDRRLVNRRDYLSRRLRRYALLLFAVGLVTISLSLDQFRGLNFSIASGLQFPLGDVIFEAVAVAGLWQFAYPLRRLAWSLKAAPVSDMPSQKMANQIT